MGRSLPRGGHDEPGRQHRCCSCESSRSNGVVPRGVSHIRVHSVTGDDIRGAGCLDCAESPAKRPSQPWNDWVFLSCGSEGTTPSSRSRIWGATWDVSFHCTESFRWEPSAILRGWPRSAWRNGEELQRGPHMRKTTEQMLALGSVFVILCGMGTYNQRLARRKGLTSCG